MPIHLIAHRFFLMSKARIYLEIHRHTSYGINWLGDMNFKRVGTRYCLMVMLVLGFSHAHAEPPAGAVTVEFVQPEKFRDASDDNFGGYSASTLASLRKYIERTAPRYLQAGQQLSIQITDIDLAGSFEPWRGPGRDVRIVRDVYPPRINLQFEWRDADGHVLGQGEKSLRNLAFQMTTVARGSDALRYEKALINDWLATEFSPSK